MEIKTAKSETIHTITLTQNELLTLLAGFGASSQEMREAMVRRSHFALGGARVEDLIAQSNLYGTLVVAWEDGR